MVAGTARRQWISGQLRTLHRWFAPPLHDQRRSFVPFAVAAPLASRHSPDCAPVMVTSIDLNYRPNAMARGLAVAVEVDGGGSLSPDNASHVFSIRFQKALYHGRINGRSSVRAKLTSTDMPG